jgi:CBS domain-containing protein
MRNQEGNSMAIADLCTRDVVHVDTLQSVKQAARLMREHHIGSVVIVEHDGERMRPVGMITDRDVAVAVVAEGLDPTRTPVVRVMGTGIVVVREDEGIDRAFALMRAEGIRRLPVVDSTGSLVGILTADDLIYFLADEMGGSGGLLSREVARERALRPEGPPDTAASASY